jgi:flagellar assembly factor FliW
MNAPALALSPAPDEVAVRSALLGDLVLPASQVFAFEHGILGFPEARSFALVPARQNGVFWLQSLDFEALTFLLVDPFPLVNGYVLELGSPELGRIGPRSPAEVLVLTILTLARDPGQPATANLQGPLVLDLGRRTGRQVVLQDSSFGVRHPVTLPGTPRA